MEIIKTSIDGVLIIEPRVFKDERGYFFESFSQREFDENRRTSERRAELAPAIPSEEEEDRRSEATPIHGHSINF
ncbi:MAG: dTDP-4-dehydrorhamnose 3,5-epimerase family protein, partial [Prevotella sp.]